MAVGKRLKLSDLLNTTFIVPMLFVCGCLCVFELAFFADLIAVIVLLFSVVAF